VSEYAKSGVDHGRKDAGLGRLVQHLRGTLANNPHARVRDDHGYYASVVELPGRDLAFAISTDSVATKVLVAQMAGKHDTVGIDCVALNVNDVVCVGAEPVALVDYIGVDRVDAEVLEEIGRGFAEGARRAEVSIPGGEIAQVRDLIRGHGDGPHYDLVGTALGVLHPANVIDGASVVPGDVVVGIASTGLHSNGYSLARRIVFETLGKRIHERLEECGRTVAEELLEPSGVYVRECKALLREGVPVHALLNITGGGFTNLLRVAAPGVGFCLDALPEPPPIFSLLQHAGRVSAAEMHEVFNMGIGFAVVLPASHSEAVTSAAKAEGKTARVIGRVVADPDRRVVIVRPHLSGCLVAKKAKAAFMPSAIVPREHHA
jgi:phosphoribosylformylglycinamidine cyclo-ligase